MPISRRGFLAGGAMAAHGMPALAASPAREPSYASEHPDMLVAHLAKKLNALAGKWDAERARIRTAADVETRNRFVREKFREMLGPFPERNPLQARVTATLERDGYRVENVMFQSRPDFWVTGNVYVPAGKGPFPAVIAPCGHSLGARLERHYQLPCLSLVKQGFVAFSYDPVGQGERRQYWNPLTGETESGLTATFEHSMSGQLLILLGENLTNYRVWDGMRAIDYLLARPDVDPERIGCAGISGGGTLTMFISAIDERVKCAVINEGGTGHRWPVRATPGDAVGPADVEQNIFPAALHGVDLCDLHVAIAPRPLLATIEHYSPRFLSAAEHIRTRYTQLGVPEKFATEEATDPHAWTYKLRQANTNWLCRWLQGRKGPDSEPDFVTEPAPRLWLMPNGSIRYSQCGDTIFSLILKKGAALPPRSEGPMQERIRECLRFRKSAAPLAPRHIVTTPRRGYTIEKVEFVSEPGIYIPAWVFVPETPAPGPPLLFVDEAGKQAEGMEFGLMERLVRKGRLALSVDVRGIGETAPRYAPGGSSSREFAHLFNVETSLSYMSWFMDESLIGMRVQDVVRSVDYLVSRAGSGQQCVRAAGRGMGALWVLFAAALDSRICSAACEGVLLSYRSLTAADRYLHGADVFIRGVLKHFDLPQVAAAVAGRELVLAGPVDAMKRPVELSAAREACRAAVEAFERAGAAARFRIVARGPDFDLFSLLS